MLDAPCSSPVSKNQHRQHPSSAISIAPTHYIGPAESLPYLRGARSLGWNMAQALAEAGAKAIALLDVKQELGVQAAAELHATTGIPVQFYNVDVRDENTIAEAASKISSDLGSVDIVINSAGVVE